MQNITDETSEFLRILQHFEDDSMSPLDQGYQIFLDVHYTDTSVGLFNRHGERYSFIIKTFMFDNQKQCLKHLRDVTKNLKYCTVVLRDYKIEDNYIVFRYCIVDLDTAENLY